MRLPIICAVICCLIYSCSSEEFTVTVKNSRKNNDVVQSHYDINTTYTGHAAWNKDYRETFDLNAIQRAKTRYVNIESKDTLIYKEIEKQQIFIKRRGTVAELSDEGKILSEEVSDTNIISPLQGKKITYKRNANERHNIINGQDSLNSIENSLADKGFYVDTLLLKFELPPVKLGEKHRLNSFHRKIASEFLTTQVFQDFYLRLDVKEASVTLQDTVHKNNKIYAMFDGEMEVDVKVVISEVTKDKGLVETIADAIFSSPKQDDTMKMGSVKAFSKFVYNINDEFVEEIELDMSGNTGREILGAEFEAKIKASYKLVEN